MKKEDLTGVPRFGESGGMVMGRAVPLVSNREFPTHAKLTIKSRNKKKILQEVRELLLQADEYSVGEPGFSVCLLDALKKLVVYLENED